MDNQMYAHIEGYPEIAWQLFNVKSLIRPTVLAMSSDFTSWRGENFIGFASVKIGSGKQQPLPIDAPAQVVH